MFLELLIAGHFQTYQPAPEPVKEETTVTQIVEVAEEPAPPEKEEPTEPSLEEKIRSNYYNCNTDTQYIRADNAQCLAKPVSKPQTTLKARTQAQNSSQSYYQAGQCTAWVASKRYVPNGWGNASNWKNAAQRAGWTVSKTPVAGAIAWRSGHVAYVESTNGHTITITEQNYRYIPFEVRTITVPTSSYSAYLY